jgi:hypothetical protein
MPKPRAKKAKVSQSKDDAFETSDPQELIAHSREAAIKQLKSKHEFQDLDIAIKTVRALVVTNEEIWSRCRDKYSVGGNVFIMKRVKQVDVWSHDDMTTVSAIVETVSEDFDTEPLRVLPESLRLFEPKKDDAKGVTDFKAFFSTCLITHEDVLLPLLSKLKEHLEKVQVCLGRIDEWVMQSTKNIEFLNTTFNVNMGEVLEGRAYNRCLCDYYCVSPYSSCPPCNGKILYDIADYSMTGTVVKSFELSTEKDRAQLKKLVDFLSTE